MKAERMFYSSKEGRERMKGGRVRVKREDEGRAGLCLKRGRREPAG